MHTTIQKWGNSHGIRIPKQLMDALDLRESDRVEIGRHKDVITIRKVTKRHRTLGERMAGYEGPYTFSEWDTGTSVGNEVL
jgi:antitoxin MazE